MNRPDVSIVIVCMNRTDNLYPCLQSIRDHTGVSYECLVVAYMFDPAALAKAKEDFPWAEFIESNEIRGFSENNNLALRRARGRFCFVLNDDTEFSTPVIDSLMADFEHLPKNTAIVSPKLVNADGSLQLCGRPPYPARNYLLQQWHRYSEPIDNVSGRQPEFGQVYRSWNITGACFLIRTEIFEQLGWFDETYFFTPEDIALGTLAVNSGYTLWVDASVEVTHKWRTTASRIAPAVRPAAVKGSLLFFSGGSRLRYFLLATGVWFAEFSKRVKARIRWQRSRTEEDRIKLQTFRNITANIFNRLTPKEIFKRYYNA
ncbi:MAG: glycosyltransferase [Bacteroidales bacterium]|nr:glycosyltransferase [Bacteroidales bacterium]